MKKVMLSLVLSLFAVLLFSGCKSDEVKDPNAFYVYFKEASASTLYPVPAVLDHSASFDEIVSSVWNHLTEGPSSAKYVSPVPAEVELKGVSLDESDLVFNFSASYNALSAETELLLRAAIVRTYTQMSPVNAVEIHVEDQPLILSDGTLVSSQKSSDFVDLFGSGYNAFKEGTFKLFFGSEDGKGLVEVTREVNYKTSLSPEQEALSLLLKGPNADEKGIRLFPKDLKVISVSTRNEVCTVNFGPLPGDTSPSVLPEVFVYAIVNTLTEINGVSSVQFMENGSAASELFDSIFISNPFYRDLDYVKTEESVDRNLPESDNNNLPKEPKNE